MEWPLFNKLNTVIQRGINSVDKPMVMSGYGSESLPKPQYNENGTEELVENGSLVELHFSPSGKHGDGLKKVKPKPLKVV